PVIKESPEDFVVEEIPAYEPSGTGNHVYVRFTKRDMTTDAAVRAIARALEVDARNAGVAGMKDKRAVTTQTISLEPQRGKSADELAERARALALPDITILGAQKHGNKLKTGHLHGNRFAIVVRKLGPDEARAIATRVERVKREGVPNAFGEQRFGRDADNAERALAILNGKEPEPRDKRLLRLLYSALQSDVFNLILAERVARGTWATPMLGDVLKKTETGGLFVCTDEQEDRARAERGEVSPTGPLVGPKMPRAEGEPGEIEMRIARERLGGAFDAAMSGALGEGTRRAFRLLVSNLRVVSEASYNSVAVANGEHETGCRLEFVLPKGAFATTVLAFLTGTEAG
ncbi:MAG TPA: tRNA pseudouridine(13) synthase TruD, partial [Polyangiaceae bacterium]